MMSKSSLDRMRFNGVRILLFSSLIWTSVLIVIGWVMGSEHVLPAISLSVLVNILPMVRVLQQRRDMETRLLMGTLAAIQPAIGLFLMSGHPLQMDGHMYFFVTLAGLTLLYDWRPILLCAALVALHHLVLTYLAPTWVFYGEAEILRVLIHAVTVAGEAAVLCYLTIRLRLMLLAQDAHVKGAAELAEEAQAGRKTAEDAIEAVRQAGQRENMLRAERDREKADIAQERRAEMVVLVDAFRRSVTDIVSAVSAATRELDDSAHMLNDLARCASIGTGETRTAAEQSSASAAVLAQRIEQLSHSIGAIAAAAHQQATLGGEAQKMSAAGHVAARDLEGRTSSINGFADSINEIASRTNLLALNASIEAARAGDVGLGFAVVANEVKQLASQTSNATGQIHALALSAREGAGVAQEVLSDVASAVEELAQAADAIQHAVADQRDATAMIEQSARDTARDATVMARRMEDVADVARNTENLSTRVSSAATGLSQTAQALERATDLFVAQLEAA